MSQEDQSFFSFEDAIRALEQDQLVGLPTETVYGLGARIDHPEAIKKIFQLKDRPLYDPLIVHIGHLEQVNSLAKITDGSTWEKDYPLMARLAQEYWPGPLTLVFPKNPETVSDLITSDHDTVAVRMPEHDLTLRVLKGLQLPVAAPSANPFKRTSPTSAEHVKAYFPELLVLDGGPCQVGIESTIVKQSGPNSIEILRPGMLTAIDLQMLLPEVKVLQNTEAHGPGSMKEHYQPEKPVFLIKTQKDLSPQEVLKHLQMNIEISLLEKYDLNERLHKIQMNELVLNQDPNICAREIYRQMIELSQSADIIYIYWQSHLKSGESWLSILNRLGKAAHKVIEV